MVIVCKKLPGGYTAYLKDEPLYSGTGDNIFEAIGFLIYSHPDKLEIELER